jgi:hypothetical protein
MKRASLWLIFVAVLVVGAVVWVPRLSSELPTTNQRLHHEVFFRCENCGHAFGLTPPELGLMWRDVTPTPATQGKATCPKCRKPFCAFGIDEVDFRKGDLNPASITKPTAPERGAPPVR